MPAPAKLGELMGTVLRCQLRYDSMSEGERRAAKEREGARVADARTVALEWASEFSVWAQGASAHEITEAGVRLREILRG